MLKFKQVTESGPEPISLIEAKSWLRVETTDEDDLIRALLLSARTLVESHTKSSMLARIWLASLDAWPSSQKLILALQPFPLLTALRVSNGTGFVSVPNNAFVFTSYEGSGCLFVEKFAPQPQIKQAGIELELATDPTLRPQFYEPMKMAMRLLVTRWFAQRGDQPDMGFVPADVRALLNPLIRRRLA